MIRLPGVLKSINQILVDQKTISKWFAWMWQFTRHDSRRIPGTVWNSLTRSAAASISASSDKWHSKNPGQAMCGLQVGYTYCTNHTTYDKYLIIIILLYMHMNIHAITNHMICTCFLHAVCTGTCENFAMPIWGSGWCRPGDIRPHQMWHRFIQFERIEKPNSKNLIPI